MKRRKVIIPDILANAGGVTVSYFEWVQNHQRVAWSEAEVFKQLVAKLEIATAAIVKMQRQYSVDLRLAAYLLAIRRVIAAQAT